MDLKVGKGSYMKTFHSIFALTLSIICIAYLLFCPKNGHFLFHNFSTEALAAENEHNTLSNAFSLSFETTYQEHIAAHDKRYYYIPFQKNINFQITSSSIRNLKISFLSDTGQSIPYNKKFSKNSKLLTLSADLIGKRIFLCLSNQSASSCSFKIFVSYHKKQHTETAKPATKKDHSIATPDKIPSDTVTIHHPKINKKATSNPTRRKTNQQSRKNSKEHKTTSIPYVQKYKNKTKLSTTNSKNVELYPQFMKMAPGAVEKLKISSEQSISDIIWLSTNPLAVSVEHGKVHAKKEGIAIIYIRQKNYPDITSSCFIRVIERT